MDTSTARTETSKSECVVVVARAARATSFLTRTRRAQVADLLQQRPDAHHSAPLPQPPAWLVNWERKRPTLLIECLAEAIGVFMYVFPGLGASAAFLVTTVAKEAGFGQLLNIGIAYALGIVCASRLALRPRESRADTDSL